VSGALVQLPGGGRLRVRRARKGAARVDDVVEGTRLFAGRTLGALLAGEVVVEPVEGASRVPLDRAAILALDVRDFHALRDACERLGAVAPEETQAGECRNCDTPLAADPRGIPLDDLEERHAGEPVVREMRVPLGMAVRVGRGRVRDALLRAPTVEAVRPLWAALAKDAPLRVTPALVRALGVRALGKEKRATVLARVLAEVPDRAWTAIEQGFLEVAYGARALRPLLCPACGALHEVDAPLVREFDGPRGRDPEMTFYDGDALGGFPDAARFEALVARVGAEVYAARGVRNIALRVEVGVPELDTGGEPLLGSYEPRQDVDAAGNVAPEFLVTVYYRSFARMHAEEGAYDVEAEVRETIDHEIEHHLHYLSGHDPMDEEERAAARRDLEDVYGAKTLARLERREVLRDLARGLRFVVPLLLGLAALLWGLDWLGLLG
jgi:hypothetical protein